MWKRMSKEMERIVKAVRYQFVNVGILGTRKTKAKLLEPQAAVVAIQPFKMHTEASVQRGSRMPIFEAGET